MIPKIIAALKKMKKHEAPCISGLVAEMIEVTGDIRIQWLTNLYSGIMKEGCIPEYPPSLK